LPPESCSHLPRRNHAKVMEAVLEAGGNVSEHIDVI
jgi:hypothetical protein